MQSYQSASVVAPGGTASFVVFAWSQKAAASSVSVTVSVPAASSYLGSPGYTICPSASGATCKIKTLPTGEVFELLATVPVAASAPPSAAVVFRAKASARGAVSFTSSATDHVVSEVPATAVPSLSSGSTPPLIGLPPIPGTTITPTSPSQLFPAVGPATTAPTQPPPLSLPAPKPRVPSHAAEVSSVVPIDARLIGAQLLGLAVLAGAVTMAITRLSLRKNSQPAAAGGDGPAPGKA